MRKSVYILSDLGCFMSATTGRYLTCVVQQIDVPSAGLIATRKINNYTVHQDCRGERSFDLLGEPGPHGVRGTVRG